MKKILPITLATTMSLTCLVNANAQYMMNNEMDLLQMQPESQIRPELDSQIPTVQTTVVAKVSNTNLITNGTKISVDAYMIDNNNYIKLRDLATIINNTEKNFEVLWNNDTKSIEMTSKTPYTVVGGEMIQSDGTSKTATLTTSTILIDGKVSNLTAYKIDENNYFKLRDIMQIFDVYVGWDQSSLTATLDTSMGYEVETNLTHGEYLQESSLNSSDFFSNRDYETALNDENPTYITLNGSSISVNGDGATANGSVLTITEKGTYVLSGTLTDGQIVVNMTDDTQKAQIVLDNASINCSTEAGINVISADKVFVTTTDNSKNYITSKIDENTSIDGGIFSKCDITLNGEGTLEITVENGDGIVGKDEVTITSGTYKITADGHGIDSNDGVAIANGTFEINAGKDGIHAEHSTNTSKGYVYILDGKFDIIAKQDGIDASGFLEINNGEINITTNGGWQEAPVKQATANTGGGMIDRDQMFEGNQTTDRDQMLGNNQMTDRDQMLEGLTEDEMLALRDQMMGDRNELLGGFGDLPQDMPEVSTETESTTSAKGLKASNAIRLYAGTYNLDCYDDAIHSDISVEIHGGDYVIATADDGIHANWETVITGGNIIITNSFEGIEGQRILISGGYIDMTCGDDGINAAGANLDTSNTIISIVITGGTIIMDTSAEGDGLDSNGSILITGGDILVSSTTDQRDTALDSEQDSIITGGRFIGTGSYSMTIQNFDEGSTQGSIVVTLQAMQSGRVTLCDENGTVLVEFDPVKEYQAVIISIEELEIGGKYTLTAGDYVEQITMTSLQYGLTAGSTTSRPGR